MFRILNRQLMPAVPTIPTAGPDVRLLRLHGRHVAFDCNSLCALEVDEELARKIQSVIRKTDTLERSEEVRSFRGLIFSREKPQFRLKRAAPVRRVVLNVTHGCNLACVYCFAGGHHAGKAMTLETARKAMRLIGPRTAIDLGFFGGEPLLAWDLIRQVMVEARELAVVRKVKTRFHITSNGLLLDEEKVRFLSKQPCSMLISLDGPEEIHNTARPARDRRANSFRKTMDALERAQGTPLGRRIMVRATFNTKEPQLVRRLGFFAELMDRGLIRGFSAEPAVLSESCSQREHGIDRKQMAGEYHEAAVWFLDRARGSPARILSFPETASPHPLRAPRRHRMRGGRRIRHRGARRHVIRLPPRERHTHRPRGQRIR